MQVQETTHAQMAAKRRPCPRPHPPAPTHPFLRPIPYKAPPSTHTLHTCTCRHTHTCKVSEPGLAHATGCLTGSPSTLGASFFASSIHQAVHCLMMQKSIRHPGPCATPHQHTSTQRVMPTLPSHPVSPLHLASLPSPPPPSPSLPPKPGAATPNHPPAPMLAEEAVHEVLGRPTHVKL